MSGNKKQTLHDFRPSVFIGICLVASHTVLSGRVFSIHWERVCVPQSLGRECSIDVSVQLVQSLSRVRLFATPWIAARQASLPISNSRSSLRLMSSGTPLQYSCLENPMGRGAWKGCWELDMTERLHFHFSLSCIGRKWQPTPVFLPRESQGRGSLMGCRLWGRTESDATEAT